MPVPEKIIGRQPAYPGLAKGARPEGNNGRGPLLVVVRARHWILLTALAVLALIGVWKILEMVWSWLVHLPWPHAC